MSLRHLWVAYHRHGRRTGRTWLILQNVLAAARAGERVMLVMATHEEAFRAEELLQRMGATPDEIRKIKMVNSLTATRGTRGPIFIDHHYRELHQEYHPKIALPPLRRHP